MKKNTLRATDENILQSIKCDTIGRSKEVKSFIEALDGIEENMFISLDARWGEGKTFYVRQIELSLKYAMLKRLSNPEENNSELSILEESFRDNIHLNSIQTKHSYLPIYYDAWLYDNHDDALMSLILILTKMCGKYINTTLVSANFKEKFKKIISSLEISLGVISLSEISKIKDVDILSSIKTAEDIKECVKDILDSIIVERAQKLIVFIDELDRCKPSFAIELLERIKHYFEDDRIIFVISVNKEQLIHTISNYYGSGFDSTRYLNKFFDINLRLPLTTILTNINLSDERYHLQEISNELSDYYGLSLRDILIYKQHIENLSQKINDRETVGVLLSLFVPVILILDIVKQQQLSDFFNGNENILNELINHIPSMQKLVIKFGYTGKNDKEKLERGREKILHLYNHFWGKKDEEYFDGEFGVPHNFKEICMGICNYEFSVYGQKYCEKL